MVSLNALNSRSRKLCGNSAAIPVVSATIVVTAALLVVTAAQRKVSLHWIQRQVHGSKNMFAVGR